MTSRSKRRLTVASLLLGILGVGLWLTLRHRGPRYVRRDPTRHVAAPPINTAGHMPAPWLVVPGLPSRRVAGVVLDEQDQPVAGVRVSLANLGIYGDDPPVTTTGGDGRFDLGEQPPATVVLTAFVADRAPAVQNLTLDDAALDAPPDRLVIHLVACPHWMTGRVHDADGHAVAGARIVMSRMVGGAAGVAPILDVPADDAGGFRVCHQSRGIFSATAPGYDETRVSGTSPVDIVLRPGQSLDGLVIDDHGAPLGGTIVQLQGGITSSGGYAERRAPLWRSTVAGPDGTYHFDGVGAGEYTLAADHLGYLPALNEMVELSPGGHGRRTLRMTSCPRALGGHVTEHGEPLAGARVMFGQYKAATTRSDGSFFVPCWLADATTVGIAGKLVKGGDLIPAGTTTIDDLVIEVDRTAEIRGFVRIDGAPAAGVTVTDGGRKLMSMEAAPSATSQADGSFRLSATAGTHFLRATGDHGRRSGFIAVDVTDDIDVDNVVLDLEVGHRGRIVGTVKDEHGAPVGDVSVRVSGGDLASPDAKESFLDELATQSDEHGEFEVHGLGPGEYRVTPSYDAKHSAVVVLDHDDEVGYAALIVKAKDGTIAGRVIFEDGSPAAYAALSTSDGEHAIADAQGEWELKRVPHVHQWIRAVAEDGSAGKLEATPDATGLTVKLPRSVTIEGTAIGAGDGAILELSSTGPQISAGESDWRRHTLDGTTFREEGLPLTDYIVSIKGPAGAASATIHVTPGSVGHVDLIAGATGTVHAALRVFPAGGPASGITCFVGTVRGTSDQHGRVEFHDVVPGTGKVSCMDLDHEAYGESLPYQVAPGGSADVDVAVLTTASLALGGSHMGGLGATFDMAGDTGRAAITEITPDGAAAKAGLQVGDALLAIDGVDATGSAAYVARMYLFALPAGTTVALRVQRDAATVDVSVAIP